MADKVLTKKVIRLICFTFIPLTIVGANFVFRQSLNTTMDILLQTMRAGIAAKQ